MLTVCQQRHVNGHGPAAIPLLYTAPSTQLTTPSQRLHSCGNQADKCQRTYSYSCGDSTHLKVKIFSKDMPVNGSYSGSTMLNKTMSRMPARGATHNVKRCKRHRPWHREVLSGRAYQQSTVQSMRRCRTPATESKTRRSCLNN